MNLLPTENPPLPTPPRFDSLANSFLVFLELIFLSDDVLPVFAFVNSNELEDSSTVGFVGTLILELLEIDELKSSLAVVPVGESFSSAILGNG